MRADKKFTEAMQFLREQPDAYLVAQARVAETQIQHLNKQKHELVKQDAPREKVKDMEDKITAVMQRVNQAVERQKERQ